MYNTKKEVDAHVRASLYKLRSESERQLRSFSIAKLYYRINEFASAEQYLSSYLALKEDNDQAHKMIGQCYKRLKKPEKALQSFQRSLQLNPKQPDLLVDICQMLLDDQNINTNMATYWCDLAESEKVEHDAVFSLRLKLMNKENVDTNQIENYLLKEIHARPNDVGLRVRLVRKYLEQNKLLAAFNYIQTIEMTQNDAFTHSGEWYNVVWLVLSRCEQMSNVKKDWDFWILVAMCLERQIDISFSSLYTCIDKTITSTSETTNLLFNLDQYLFKISELTEKISAPAELVALFLDHYRGQFLLHAVALIYKRELLQNKNQWRLTVKQTLPLLLLAFQVKPPIKNENWMKHCDEQSKKLIQIWQREGGFRCAQVGRTLLSCIADEDTAKDKGSNSNKMKNLLSNVSTLWNSEDELLAQIRQTCSDNKWRHNIFALLFSNEQKLKEQTSQLIRSTQLIEPVYELPTYSDIETCEDIAQYLRPQSLQHMVYLCLDHDNLSYVRAKCFSALNFSTQNLSFCGAESINQLDVDSFLYAACIQAKRMLQVERETFDNYHEGNYSATGKPRILPFVLLERQLCTEEQAIWWKSAYKVYKGLANGNLAELRATLQFGIEAVRGINGPKIDMAIVFKLGQIFLIRAQDIIKPVEKSFLEARVECIYKYGLNMLKLHNKGALEPYHKYFKYTKSDTAAVEREVIAAAEDAVSFLAARYFKKSEFVELIEEFSGIQVPFATYMQAEAYRKLDEAGKTPRETKRRYLDRASDCLNQTLLLLKNTQTDPDHPLNSIIHNELKRLQQTSARYLNDSCGTSSYSPLTHNNSSTYEDAEADFYAESSIVPVNNRSRREAAALLNSTHNTELESLVKQMATTLTFVKEEIVDTIKPEVVSMRKEITSLKDKIAHLEDAMKKTRISTSTSNPPSRDDASHVLDDLYIIEDALQNQLYQQQPTSQSNILSQQQRIHTPNAMQMQQNAAAAAAAAAYSPIFNPNYPMAYYTPPYMMAQGANGSAGQMMCQRNSMPLPYMETSGMNFNLPPNTPLLPQPTAQDPGRPNNLYGLLTQQSNTAMAMPSIAGNIAPGTAPPPQAPVQLNKILNSQPVEKGPPANVVISSSDPLPNPNISLQTMQPTLSVTIPPHHIKPSIVQTSDANAPPALPSGLFGMSTTPFTGSNFGGFSNNANATTTTGIAFPTTNLNKPITSNVSSSLTFSTSTSVPFSFKPQVAQAKQINAEANDNLIVESFSSDQNKSGSNESEAEYDPRPDFQAIIPLPDEIIVKTGEEDEEIMFCYRAKLFRNMEKEWKERGIGDIKILKGKDGNSRILMRRDQTHKICANHKITKEIVLTTPANESKARIWVANDFADEQLKLEKLLLRFKLPETAEQFEKAFKLAQQEAIELENNRQQQPKSEMRPPQVNEKVKVPPFGLSKSAASNFATSTPVNKSEAMGLLAKPMNIQQSSTAPASSTTTITTSSVTKPLFGSLNAATIEKNTKQVQNAPFANFSFEKISTTTANPVASPFANIFNQPSKPVPTLESGQFSAISEQQPATSSLLKSNNDSTSNKSDAEDDYVPTATFNPVIPLPDLVEVSTGEENEIVLFEHRAKLLRFDKKVGEWKERGVGNIKLLQDKDNVNKVRILMRREQVHKLCCNQLLQKNTNFKYVKNSLTAISWAGQDYSENELITEMLTVRFKTAHICSQFHDSVLKAQSNMSDDIAEEKVVTEKAEQEVQKGFGDAFKPKEGSWSCKDCYTSNASTNLHCASCEAPKDDTVPKKVPTSILSGTSATTFSFGFGTKESSAKQSFTFGVAAPFAAASTAPVPTSSSSAVPKEAAISGFGEQFKPKVGSWSCQACYLANAADVIYCSACGQPKDDTVPNKENNSVLNLSNSAPKFSFGFPAVKATDPPKIASSGFNFGQSTAAANQSAGEIAKSFSFPPQTSSSTTSALGKPTFTFTLQSKAMESPAMPIAASVSTTKSKSPMRFGGGDADIAAAETDNYQEEENTTYFTPVIPLPDKIEVKTGEEDEDVLYTHRAKLYRHVKGEWKERGVGDVKILRHKESKKLRVVMRREQIWKICLNHILNADVQYKSNDDKSCLFVVNDFSEGAVELEKFLLRFKTKDIAQGFLEAVKSAISGKALVTDGTPVNGIPTKIDTPESLPKNVMPITEPSCEGCRGCDSDKFDFSSLIAKETFVNDQDINNPLYPLEMPALTLPKSLNRSLLLKQSALSPSSAIVPSEPLKDNREVSGSTLFSSVDINKPSSVAFSFTSALNASKPNETKTESSGFFFGNSGASLFGGDNKPVFGEKPLFGNLSTTNVTEKPKSLFDICDKREPLFGQAPMLFGNISTNLTNTTQTVNAADKPKSFFSVSETSNDSLNSGTLFGGNSNFSLGTGGDANKNVSSANGSDKLLFGKSGTDNLFYGGSQQNAQKNDGNLTFGATSPTSFFGGNKNVTNSPLLFGANTKDNQSADNATAGAATFADLSNKVDGIDFASLAAKANNNTSVKTSSPAGFIGLTNQDAFSSFRPSNNNNKLNTSKFSDGDNQSFKNVENADGGDDGNDNESVHDPHFEPIIALPDEIVVRTGEEEETKLFGERAMLFRYDNNTKEWKERGVGEMKILLHPKHQTYRLLMRREQIFKLVLNHSVGAEFTFNNLNKNPKSFVWVAMNYAESKDGVLENLAVRFKKVELADKFKDLLHECIEMAKKRSEQKAN